MMIDCKNKRLLILVSLLGVLIAPGFAQAERVGHTQDFYVNSGYNIHQREQVEAELMHISDEAYFYVEQDWYAQLSNKKKSKINNQLDELDKEFDEVIYPGLTSTYGQEWKPGIDNDPKVTILFQQMKENSAGYFRSNDEYEKIQVPDSNEREMIYVNTKYLNKKILKSYVAHEFTHLITFNQKNRLRDMQEEIWLNESRADYAPTLLGYDENYDNSNLEQRIREFVRSQTDSLTEWRSREEDYGAINAFSHYLVSHYGQEILVDSLRSSKVGIDSINYALQKNNYGQNFAGIFTDWTIATFLNDCGVHEKYCYKSDNLKDLKINPVLIFLPNTERTHLSVDYSLKPWSGHWYRIMRGEGNLNLIVDGADQANFEIPYVVCRENSDCSVKFLNLDENQRGSTTVSNFGDYNSLTLIPSVQFSSSSNISYDLSVEISLDRKTEEEEELEQLRERVANLQAKINRLVEEIRQLRAQKEQKYACSQIDQDLSVGMNNKQVKCLQQFLKAQGEIYPEGLVTGYFGSLTKAAVNRFQERYQKQILAPWSLQKGTGYVGRTTKQQINKMIGK